jgi:hypothetical protein
LCSRATVHAFCWCRLAAVAARMVPCAGDIDKAVTGECAVERRLPCGVACPRGVSAWHVCRCVAGRDARCAPAAPPLIGPAPPPRPLDRRGPPRPRTPKGVRNARTSFLKGQYGKTQSQTANRSEAANTVALHASYAWGRAPSPRRYAASWRCLLTYLLTERSSGSSKHLAIDRYLTFKRGLSH